MKQNPTHLLMILIVPIAMLFASCDSYEETFDTTVICDDESVCWNGDYSLFDHGYSLADLYGYESIAGTLLIKDSGSSNFNQTNLNGLEHLTAVGENLIIDSIESLINVEGIESLSTIGGNVEIRDNATLSDLKGLDALKAVNGNVLIENNNELKNVDALKNLTFIGGDLVITKNANLTSLKGLFHVNHIGGDLIIIVTDYYAEIIDMVIFSEGNPFGLDAGDEALFQRFLMGSNSVFWYTNGQGIDTYDNTSLPFSNVLRLVSAIGRHNIKGDVKFFHVDLDKKYQ